MDRLDVGRPGFRAVRVRVSARDIAEGRRMDCFGCPIARAITRHLKPELVASVAADVRGRYKAWIFSRAIDLTGYPEVALPSRAGAFVADFDTVKPVKPFAFNLPLPVAALKRSGVARG